MSSQCTVYQTCYILWQRLLTTSVPLWHTWHAHLAFADHCMVFKRGTVTLFLSQRFGRHWGVKCELLLCVLRGVAGKSRALLWRMYSTSFTVCMYSTFCVATEPTSQLVLSSKWLCTPCWWKRTILTAVQSSNIYNWKDRRHDVNFRGWRCFLCQY